MSQTFSGSRFVFRALPNFAVVSVYLLIQFLFRETPSASSRTHTSFCPQHQVNKSSTDKFPLKNPPFLSVLPLLCVGVTCCHGLCSRKREYSVSPDYSSVPLLILWAFAMVSLVHPFSRCQRHRNGPVSAVEADSTFSALF